MLRAWFAPRLPMMLEPQMLLAPDRENKFVSFEGIFWLLALKGCRAARPIVSREMQQCLKI